MPVALPLAHSPSLPARASAQLPPAAPSHAGVYATSLPPGCVNSTEILRGQKAVEISHNGLTYRLQSTRLGKLILTK